MLFPYVCAAILGALLGRGGLHMLSAGDFRNGVTFEMDGSVWQIIEFQHVKPGKGAAFVRTKIRNVIAGSVVERTFSPGEKFPTAYIERREMAYSYQDDDLCYFLDGESYEMIPVNKRDLPDSFRFVKEDFVCKILSYKGNVFGVEPPTNVTLQITKTDPGFKGDTATNATKPATLETGAEIKVPLFIEEGEFVVVDTRTGEYSSRA
jgi:elongation factor P